MARALSKFSPRKWCIVLSLGIFGTSAQVLDTALVRQYKQYNLKFKELSERLDSGYFDAIEKLDSLSKVKLNRITGPLFTPLFGSPLLIYSPLNYLPAIAKQESTKGEFERNEALQQLFMDNSDITHITYAFMTLRDTASPVIDANIALNFLAFPKHWRLGLTVTPKFKLRMLLGEPSPPIRTPSNMIGGTLFYHFSKNYSLNYDKTFLGETYYKFLMASFVHHSNGQDAGSFKNGLINLKTGNFAVNYLEFGIMSGINVNENDSRQLNAFSKITYQHDWIVRDATSGERELEGFYGQDRINFQFNFTQTTKRDSDRKTFNASPYRFTRFVLDGSYIMETNDVQFTSFKKAINLELKTYWKVPGLPNFFLTGQIGWLGHDYYNIYFQESSWLARIGFAASTSNFQFDYNKSKPTKLSFLRFSDKKKTEDEKR